MEHCTEMDSIYDFFHPCRHLNTWWNSSLKRQDSGTDYIQSYQKKHKNYVKWRCSGIFIVNFKQV